jgi:hypothetical protein
VIGAKVLAHCAVSLARPAAPDEDEQQAGFF